MPTRTDAFVSYSHTDEYWLNRVKVHLKPLVRNDLVLWEDTQLRGGQRWEEEISNALAKARVAILLVSPDFLASDFIHTDELPPLLEAAAHEGLVILSVIVSACAFRSSPLSAFQAINPPDKPLDLMNPGQANQALVRVHDRVKELLAAPATAATGSGLKAAVPASNPESAPTVMAAPANRQRVAPTSPTGPSSLALLDRNDGQWGTYGVLNSQINGTELKLTLQPGSPTQRAFLESLQQQGALRSVVYNYRTYACKLRELSAHTQSGNTETWELKADLKDMPRGMDITYNNIGPAQHAQQQAALLLLNEHPAGSELRSLFSTPKSYVTPLIRLFHYLKRDAALFQQVAPLVATWHLQMSSIVTDIFRLDIQVEGSEITVDFEGQRQMQYQSDPAPIVVKGRCQVPEHLPAEALSVRLIK